MGAVIMLGQESRLTIHFKTEWRHDRGLRVYTTRPAGLYISSRSTYAAAEYFQRFIPGLVVLNMKLLSKGGFACDYEFEWEKIVEAGGGSLEFTSIPDEELDELGPSIRDNSGDFPPMAGEDGPEFAEFELKVESREGEKGKRYFVIYDFDEPDPFLEDIIRRQEVPQ